MDLQFRHPGWLERHLLKSKEKMLYLDGISSCDEPSDAMSGIEPVGTKHKIAMRIKELVLNLESTFYSATC